MCGRLRRRWRPHTSRATLCAFAPPQARRRRRRRRWTRPPHRAQKLRPTPIELAARVGRPTPDARQPTISLKPPPPPPPQSIFCGGRCERRSDAIIDINYCHRSRCVRTGPSDSERSIGRPLRVRRATGDHLSSGRVRARARPTERAADAPLERAKRARPLTAQPSKSGSAPLAGRSLGLRNQACNRSGALDSIIVRRVAN